MEKFPGKVRNVRKKSLNYQNHVSLEIVPLKKRWTISNETWFVILTIFWENIFEITVYLVMFLFIAMIFRFIIFKYHKVMLLKEVYESNAAYSWFIDNETLFRGHFFAIYLFSKPKVWFLNLFQYPISWSIAFLAESVHISNKRGSFINPFDEHCSFAYNMVHVITSCLQFTEPNCTSSCGNCNCNG